MLHRYNNYACFSKDKAFFANERYSLSGWDVFTTMLKNKAVTLNWLARVIFIMLLDVISVAGSFFLALWIRFDFQFSAIDPYYLDGYAHMIIYWVILCLVIFLIFKLYNSIWRFVSIDELVRIMLCYAVLGGVGWIFVAVQPWTMPRSFYCLGLLLSFISTAGIRISYRLLRRMRSHFDGAIQKTTLKNVMIIGAGEAGRQLVREFAVNSHLRCHVACLIDDNREKKGRILDGVRIVGGREEIVNAVKRYDISKIIYAIPSSNGATRKEILDICDKTGCEIQVVPGIYQLVNGEVTINNLRKVSVLDLLGRDPIEVNLNEICRYIEGKVVMVTGGGGSIGSELCRQIAKSSPKQLIVFDIYENNAYAIQMELMRTYPRLDLEVLIGSVRASKRLCEMVVQMMSRRGGTEFVAVRFGNVLGSNGSVVPLFEQQIAEGGPVTVTHPEITRFFMTIPEAVSLVLQAGYYAKGGEIFVLDMGQPVKIDDMARKLIHLSGFEPDVDIPIIYTGLRPGEKLYEELLMNEEGLQETANKLIHIGKPIEMDDAQFARQLKELELACDENADNIKELVAAVVPTYHPQ